MTFIPQWDENDDKLEFLLHSIERKTTTWTLVFTDNRFREWFERDARILRAFHSTAIEGIVVSQEIVEDIVDGRVKRPRTSNEEEVFNYLKGLEWIDSIDKDIGAGELKISPDLICQLHSKILAGDSVSTPGVYRTDTVAVKHPQTRDVVYRAPPPNLLEGLVLDLTEWLNAAAEREVNPVVISGIAHLELVAIHPFWDGNGRTARALSTLLLQSLGYGFDRLIALDVQFGINILRYFDEISSVSGKYYDFKKGERHFTQWLSYFSESVLTAARWVHDRAVDVQILRNDLRDGAGETGFTSNQIDAVAYSIVRGRIRPRDYRRITGVSVPTASKHLRELESSGVLLGKGKTRNRYYELHPDLSQKIESERDETEEQETQQPKLL